MRSNQAIFFYVAGYQEPTTSVTSMLNLKLPIYIHVQQGRGQELINAEWESSI